MLPVIFFLSTLNKKTVVVLKSCSVGNIQTLVKGGRNHNKRRKANSGLCFLVLINIRSDIITPQTHLCLTILIKK